MTTQQHLWSMTAIISTLLVGNMTVQMVNAQQEPLVPKVLVAQEFRLVNARNKTLATMSVNDIGGPQIVLFDNFVQSDNEPGRKRLELSMETTLNGHLFPRLQLNDDSGTPRVRMSLFEFKGDSDSPQIEILDGANRMRGLFGMNANNKPDLRLWGENGAYAGLKSESLEITDGSGEWRSTSWVTGRKDAGFVVADGGGKWIWMAPPKRMPQRANNAARKRS